MMRDRSHRSALVEHAGTIALVAIAGVLLTLYVNDRRRVPPRPLVPENWQEEMATGITLGSPTAPVRIVEFMDFQCPGCAIWAQRVDSLLKEFPDRVQVSFHHLPLTSIHPHAVTAAIGAECADRQGYFREYAFALFSNQSLIGIRDWREFAEEAGVPDIDGFMACSVLPSESFPRIAYGMDLGRRTNTNATPTIWLEGVWRRPSLQAVRELALRVDEGGL